MSFNPNDYWESRLTTVKGLEGVGYSKLGKQFNFWAYKIRKAAFLNALKRNGLIPEGKDVLDIGSGTGFYIDIFRALGAAKITGMDITQASIENLKKTFPTFDFLKVDIGEQLEQGSALYNSFDIISCMDVLFHIVDDDRFVQAFVNINNLLKTGGYFIYSDNFLNKNTIRTKHQVSHSKAELFRIIKETGFEIVYHQPFMVLSNYPIDSSNLLLKTYWYLLENSISIIKPLGYLTGALLYPLDKFLINKIKDSPTSEIVVLKKLTI